MGLYLRKQSNIIIRNIISSKVLASTKGDGIRIDVSWDAKILQGCFVPKASGSGCM